MSAPVPSLAGLVLAAGGGRRLGGRPKALLRAADGQPLLRRATDALVAAGCARVVVVLGAAADVAAPLVPTTVGAVPVEAVVAEDWADGMGSSLRRGIDALAGSDASALLVTLVDLPDVTGAVASRVVRQWRSSGAHEDALLRASYDGEPGHPVLLGRSHWGPLAAGLVGDVGASAYLRGRKVQQVSCDDLATGRDLDRPDDLGTWAVR